MPSRPPQGDAEAPAVRRRRIGSAGGGGGWWRPVQATACSSTLLGQPRRRLTGVDPGQLVDTRTAVANLPYSCSVTDKSGPFALQHTSRASAAGLPGDRRKDLPRAVRRQRCRPQERALESHHRVPSALRRPGWDRARRCLRPRRLHSYVGGIDVYVPLDRP